MVLTAPDPPVCCEILPVFFPATGNSGSDRLTSPDRPIALLSLCPLSIVRRSATHTTHSFRKRETEVRIQIARVAVVVAALFGLTGCGTTLTVTHTDADQAANSGIQLVKGSAPASGAATQSNTVAVLGQQTVPATAELTAKNTSLGNLVVDGNGRTLYRFDKDSPTPSKTTCTGPCQDTWPPEIVSPGGKVYANGVAASAVGSVTRPDGTTQLTIGGWPVYLFSGDHAAGDTKGQGVNGTWFVVAPDGKKASTQVSNSAGQSNSDTVLTAQRSGRGLVVADQTGKTVYVNSTDSSNPTAARCADTCASGFTPVPAKVGAVGIKGITSDDLGIAIRPDGTAQLTFVGFPLYTSTSDKQPGDTAGTRTKGWFTITLDGDHLGG